MKDLAEMLQQAIANKEHVDTMVDHLHRHMNGPQAKERGKALYQEMVDVVNKVYPDELQGQCAYEGVAALLFNASVMAFAQLKDREGTPAQIAAALGLFVVMQIKWLSEQPINLEAEHSTIGVTKH